jgi:hypothetical protein
MSFHVVWILRIIFMLERAVEGHGVGCVLRSIAANITTRPRVRNHRRLRTITQLVVEMRLDLRKRTIVLEDIIRIVRRDGRSKGLNPKHPFYTR